MKGEVFGSSGFDHKISQLISRTTRLTAHEGDRKSESYRNQALDGKTFKFRTSGRLYHMTSRGGRREHIYDTHES